MNGKEIISVTNLWKMIGTNPSLDLVNMKAYTKFGEILSICSQDIERKQDSRFITPGPFKASELTRTCIM